MNVDAVAKRVLAEFEEMPGMALTVPQASRLFGLDHAACRTVVDQLVGLSYLKWTRTGTIARAEPS
jgi:hypothetical protein